MNCAPVIPGATVAVRVPCRNRFPAACNGYFLARHVRVGNDDVHKDNNMKTTAASIALGTALVCAILTAQSNAGAGRNWVEHQGDPGGTRFSTLNQINTSNVQNLKRAWTFHTGATGGRFASTPMVID